MSKSQSLADTQKRRLAQYRDRWSEHGLNTAITAISDKLTPAQLREYELFAEYSDNFLEKISPDVAVVQWQEGALLFEEGAYIDLAFFVVSGQVEASLRRGPREEKQPITNPSLTNLPVSGNETVVLDLVTLSKQAARGKGNTQIAMLSTMDFNLPKETAASLGPGELFGEIGALSGWPQGVTARTLGPCELIQIRLPALRLMKTRSPHLKERLDRLYRERSLFAQLKTTPLLSGLADSYLEKLCERVELVSLAPDETVAVQGDTVDALYLVRSGFLKLSQRFGSDDLTVSYLSKGMSLGEVELLIDELPGWESTVTSVEYAELIRIPRGVVLELMKQDPSIEDQLWRSAGKRVKEVGYSRRHLDHSRFTDLALDLGLVQGNSILVIDLAQCTRCDDCVRACAATHGGQPRFVREGNRIGNLLIPKSCYHCKDPVCLVGCPTGAIHRSGRDDVIDVDGDICIGCATCANNCPYDAIVMHDMKESWPGDMVPTGLRNTPRFQAGKCDLCHDTGHGPACVINCPQGCAGRIDSPAALQEWLEED